MTTFVDTSALFAMLDADDANHERAAAWFVATSLIERFVTHNYVVVEAAALVHRRLGPQASLALFGDLLPATDVVVVDERAHQSAVRSWLALGTTASSLVDWVSFEMIRREGIDRAFAFGGDFAAQGIMVVP